MWTYSTTYDRQVISHTGYRAQPLVASLPAGNRIICRTPLPAARNDIDGKRHGCRRCELRRDRYARRRLSAAEGPRATGSAGERDACPPGRGAAVAAACIPSRHAVGGGQLG